MTQSCFRYPGSKAKLLPIIMNYIDQILIDQDNFIDLFVGGGSVLLDVAKKYPKMQLFANDKDYSIYCFWDIVSGNNLNKLNALLELVQQPVTIELFYKLRQEIPENDVQHAYHALFFNRTTFSGISSSGPIGGKEQKSKYTVDCRYNSKKLQDKILKCHKLLNGRTTVTCLDFSQHPEFINTDYPVYCDPPYVHAGNALYLEKMFEADHKRLFDNLKNRKNFVLSYDDCNEIRDLYKDNTIIDLSTRYCINGKKNNWESKNELVILL